jgi:hypothetical protein
MKATRRQAAIPHDVRNDGAAPRAKIGVHQGVAELTKRRDPTVLADP